jgi:hypothetical protein
MLDQEASGFLKAEFNVDVQHDQIMENYEIPADLNDDPRLKEAREKALLLNSGRVVELEAKRRLEGLKEQEASSGNTLTQMEFGG